MGVGRRACLLPALLLAIALMVMSAEVTDAVRLVLSAYTKERLKSPSTMQQGMMKFGRSTWTVRLDSGPSAKGPGHW